MDVEPRENDEGKFVYTFKDLYKGGYTVDLEDTKFFTMPKDAFAEDFMEDITFRNLNQAGDTNGGPFPFLLPEVKTSLYEQLDAIFKVAVPQVEVEGEIDAEGLNKELVNYAKDEIRAVFKSYQSNPGYIDVDQGEFTQAESTGEDSFKVNFQMEYNYNISGVTTSSTYYGVAFVEMIDGQITLVDIKSR